MIASEEFELAHHTGEAKDHLEQLLETVEIMKDKKLMLRYDSSYMVLCRIFTLHVPSEEQA
jgi:hypothetical protein